MSNFKANDIHRSTEQGNSKALFKIQSQKTLYFGSVLNEGFRSSSDIDLIVDFEPTELNKYADNYFDFKFAFEETFSRPVDLIEEKAIKNTFFKESVNNQGN